MQYTLTPVEKKESNWQLIVVLILILVCFVLGIIVSNTLTSKTAKAGQIDTVTTTHKVFIVPEELLYIGTQVVDIPLGSNAPFSFSATNPVDPQNTFDDGFQKWIHTLETNR